MNRRPLRSLPPLPPVGPQNTLAEAELVELFGSLLARGEREDETPDYEQLEAAVDGALDPVEAELFASRLAGDPVLQREFDDLVALRSQLQRKAAGRRPAAAPAVPLRRWLGYAAAAVVLAAVGVSLRPQARLGGAVTVSAAQAPSEALFADSFEGGSTAHWSN
jgi:anti-sigma factor RsiW